MCSARWDSTSVSPESIFVQIGKNKDSATFFLTAHWNNLPKNVKEYSKKSMKYWLHEVKKSLDRSPSQRTGAYILFSFITSKCEMLTMSQLIMCQKKIRLQHMVSLFQTPTVSHLHAPLLTLKALTLGWSKLFRDKAGVLYIFLIDNKSPKGQNHLSILVFLTTLSVALNPKPTGSQWGRKSSQKQWNNAILTCL